MAQLESSPLSRLMKRTFGFMMVTLTLGSLLFCAAPQSPAQQESPLKQGLAELSAGRYNFALPKFELAVKNSPSDMQARYCLAVCYHYVGRYGEAQREYGFVAKNAVDPALQRRAKKGLEGCTTSLSSISHAAKGSGGARATSFSMDGGDGAANPAELGAAAASVGQQQVGLVASKLPGAGPAAPPAFSGTYGTPKIVDVYTDWCGWCKKFEPTFEQAQSKFAGKVTFERVNAELPENKPLPQNWGVTGYPTVVFIDGAGNVVDVIHGAPKTYEIFEARIIKAFPSLSDGR
jgi:thiol-disulfide isomerase/thioredoxin